MKIRKIKLAQAEVMVPYYEANAPLDELVEVLVLPGGQPYRDGKKCAKADIKGDLVRSPFMVRGWRQVAGIIRDQASNFVREAETIEHAKLVEKIIADQVMSALIPDEKIRRPFVEASVRMTIANKGLKVTIKSKKFNLSLSQALKQREKTRTFAGSLAEELGSLSARMAAIVPHAGEQGRYREDLLRVVLERHLPTRYHVATGFIEGCPRQLDILIYDQVDYVPVFREAGVVVVPPEAVRAVIEVKTTLNAEEMADSLGKIADVAALDDRHPPFFKGIFAYRGPAKESTVTKHVLDYYRAAPYLETSGSGSDSSSSGAPSVEGAAYRDPHILNPYEHLTAVCIDRSYFADVQLLREVTPVGPLVVPILRVLCSKTDLKPQTALFIEALNEHLQVQTVKKREPGMFSNKLGHDLKLNAWEPIYKDVWGPYLWEQMNGGDLMGVTEEIEKLTARVDAWRKDGRWKG